VLKENAFMKSFNGHFKGENSSLFYDAGNIWELMRVISRQVDYHNKSRRHSALGNVAPWMYINREEVSPGPVVDLATISA